MIVMKKWFGQIIESMYGEYMETEGTSLVIYTLTTELIQIAPRYGRISKINRRILRGKEVAK